MANVKISQLPAATLPLDGTDEIPVVQDGVTKRAPADATTSQLSATLAASGGSNLVGFLQTGTSAVQRTVQSKLRDTVSVKDFGAVGDGVADDTAAFNAVIAYANSIGGTDRANCRGFNIEIPFGRYVVSTLDPILVSGVSFKGLGEGSVLLHSANGPTFQWGSTTSLDTVIGGGISSVKHEYLSTPPAAATIVKLCGANGQVFDDWHIHNIGCGLSLGHSSSRIAAGSFVSNWRGSVSNTDAPLFDLRYGAGLFVSDTAVFVSGVVTPVFTSFTASFATNVMTVESAPGQTLAVGQYIHAPGVASATTITALGTGTGGVGTYTLSTSPGTLASRTTYATGPISTTLGRTVYECSVGFWDTCQTVNCLFERFDVGLSVISGSGMTYQNFEFSNVKMDFFKRFCIYSETASGGVSSGIRSDSTCWFVSWDTNTIELNASAGYNDEHKICGTVPISGVSALFYNCTASAIKNNTFDLDIGGTNRIGTSSGCARFSANAVGFKITARGGGDYSLQGVPFQSDWGILLGANCNDFLVTGCKLEGSAGFLNYFAGNAAGSSDRLIKANARANYSTQLAGGNFVLPATGVAWTNREGFEVEVTIGGGTVTGIAKNGVSTGLIAGTFVVPPNQTLTVTYTVAPTTLFWGLP
jgi:hypothetical protein